MTQKDTQLILEMFDQITDVLNDKLDEYWEDSFVWDSFDRARMSVISARADLAQTFKRLLVNCD